MSSVDSPASRVEGRLSQPGAHINEAVRQIVDELQSLLSVLRPLADTWTGPTASYFEPLMAEWNFAANGLLGSQAQGGVLGEIAAAVNVSWNTYDGANDASPGRSAT